MSRSPSLSSAALGEADRSLSFFSSRRISDRPLPFSCFLFLPSPLAGPQERSIDLDIRLPKLRQQRQRLLDRRSTTAFRSGKALVFLFARKQEEQRGRKCGLNGGERRWRWGGREDREGGEDRSTVRAFLISLFFLISSHLILFFGGRKPAKDLGRRTREVHAF